MTQDIIKTNRAIRVFLEWLREVISNVNHPDRKAAIELVNRMMNETDVGKAVLRIMEGLTSAGIALKHALIGTIKVGTAMTVVACGLRAVTLALNGELDRVDAALIIATPVMAWLPGIAAFEAVGMVGASVVLPVIGTVAIWPLVIAFAASTGIVYLRHRNRERIALNPRDTAQPAQPMVDTTSMFTTEPLPSAISTPTGLGAGQDYVAYN